MREVREFYVPYRKLKKKLRPNISVKQRNVWTQQIKTDVFGKKRTTLYENRVNRMNDYSGKISVMLFLVITDQAQVTLGKGLKTSQKI